MSDLSARSIESLQAEVDASEGVDCPCSSGPSSCPECDALLAVCDELESRGASW